MLAAGRRRVYYPPYIAQYTCAATSPVVSWQAGNALKIIIFVVDYCIVAAKLEDMAAQN